MGIIPFIIFGGFVGWLAGKFTRGTGFGIIGNIAVGIVGSIIGSFGFGLLGMYSNSLIGKGVFALVGAIVLLYIIGKIPNKK